MNVTSGFLKTIEQLPLTHILRSKTYRVVCCCFVLFIFFFFFFWLVPGLDLAVKHLHTSPIPTYLYQKQGWSTQLIYAETAQKLLPGKKKIQHEQFFFVRFLSRISDTWMFSLRTKTFLSWWCPFKKKLSRCLGEIRHFLWTTAFMKCAFVLKHV